MGSILRPKISAENTPKNVPQVPQITTYPLPKTITIQQKPQRNSPNQTHQFNEYLLYESEFHGDTYVSAHLQRLQHGIVDSPNIHGDRKHVTFVAVEFCFHPAFEHDHRFRNCIIEVTASRDRDNGGGVGKEMLRFIKYAPHLAFGRISSESLKWTFQLGAKLGVTQGPVDVSVNPSGSYERDRTVGTMMKIQGTTRSISASLLPPNSTHHNPPHRSDLRDRKIVWSLEENDQQEAGLPREFTFVFLVEQPHVAGGKIVSDVVVGDISNVFKDLTIGIKVKPSVTGFGVDGFENEYQYTTVRGEVGQRFYTADEYQLQDQLEHPQPILTQIVGSATSIKQSASTAVKNGTASIKKKMSNGSANGTGNAVTTKTTNPITTTTTQNSTITMSPVKLTPVESTASITTEKPPSLADSADGSTSDAIADTITNIFKPNRPSSATPEKQNLHQQRGKSPGPPGTKNQTGPVSFNKDVGISSGVDISEKPRTATMQSEKSLVPLVEKTLFNFALMEGSFEDLIELPGNAVTSMQPTLPEGK